MKTRFTLVRQQGSSTWTVAVANDEPVRQHRKLLKSVTTGELKTVAEAIYLMPVRRVKNKHASPPPAPPAPPTPMSRIAAAQSVFGSRIAKPPLPAGATIPPAPAAKPSSLAGRFGGQKKAAPKG